MRDHASHVKSKSSNLVFAVKQQILLIVENQNKSVVKSATNFLIVENISAKRDAMRDLVNLARCNQKG